MPSAERQDRRLKIVSCRQVYSGKNQLGHEYTIYEVEAAREDGRLVNEKLRAFRALPVGQVIEVSIEPFLSDRHGKSFTLHPKQSTSPGGTGQLNEAVALLQEMKTLVTKLEERVEKLEAQATTPTPTTTAPGAPPSSW